MQTNLNEQFEQIERNSKSWRSLIQYDRTIFEKLNECLQGSLAMISDKNFLNLIVHRRVRLFDLFEHIARNLFDQWSKKKRSFLVEETSFLTLLGSVHRRLTLILQNDNDGNSEQLNVNLHLQQHVQKLLFGENRETFEFLLEILPNISEHDFDLIEMVIPWYEAYIHFEHSYVDTNLDEDFLRFNQQIIPCLRSHNYERSLVLMENQTKTMITARHRFYLGMCTMAMGVHVNSDENECDEAKRILEIYLPRYISFIHHFLLENSHLTSNNLSCLTGIITYLVNYTLIINNDHHRQLLKDLFSLCLCEEYYPLIRRYWSTYETILLDSIICYLIIYCYDDQVVVKQLLENVDDYVELFEKLIEQSEKNSNRRITILSKLFLLILLNSNKQETLTKTLVKSCLNCIETALKNISTYHYNRIPMSMFFKSLMQIVKHEYIQELILENYFDLFIETIRNYENFHLNDNPIYHESVIILWNILWSISFHERVKKRFQQLDEQFLDIILSTNINARDVSIKQSTCGLLYNLDRLDFTQVKVRLSFKFLGSKIQLFVLHHETDP